MKSDVVVIGAGPGGYVAALRLGQLGKEVTLIDKHELGGTCLHVGCIPSKALITAAKKYEELGQLGKMGISVGGQPSIDFSVTQKWKSGLIDQLTKGILFLCKKNKVNFLKGEARFKDSKSLEVKTSDGVQDLEFSSCIIATGSAPIEIPGFKFDGKEIVSSSEALAFDHIPEQLAIIGGGYIGLELGSLYAKLGSKVSVIEMTEGLLPGFDREAVAVIERQLRKDKVEIFLETKAKGYERQGQKLILNLDRKGESINLEAAKILVTVGRKPSFAGVDLERSGVKADARGFITVNESLQTNVPHIYAIGDVASQPQLAHKASREAEVAAEHIAGKNTVYDAKSVAGVVFTDPELASVGLTEKEVREKGVEPLIGKFPFIANSKSVIAGHTAGFVKIVADNASHVILGVQIVGHEAGNMISEACVLLEMGARVDDLALIIHPHPTVPEAMMEAAKAALGEAIHIANA